MVHPKNAAHGKTLFPSTQCDTGHEKSLPEKNGKTATFYKFTREIEAKNRIPSPLSRRPPPTPDLAIFCGSWSLTYLLLTAHFA